MLFLGCTALCFVISFLVLWSTCLSSSLVLIMNCPRYCTRGTDQVFIPIFRFQLQSLVSKSFPVFLRYPFFHFRLLYVVRFQVLLIFFFSKRSVPFFIWQFYSLIICIFLNLVMCMADFSMANFIPVPNFAPKLVCFFCIQLLIRPRAFLLACW